MFAKLFVLIFIIYLDAIHTTGEPPAPTTTEEPEIDMITTLSKKYNLFAQVLEEYIDKSLEPLARFKEFVIQSGKAYSVVEPTPKETDQANKAMSLSFGLTSGLLPDDNRTMEAFCEERRDRREMARNYVTRKYTLNMICRLAFGLIQKQMTKQNDIYCDSESSREEFIKNAKQIKEYEQQLSVIRFKYKMSLIAIQRSQFGFSKVRTFCCSFYKFQNDTLDAIENPESKQFYKNMLDQYFSYMTAYFCFYYSVWSCMSYKPPINLVDNEFSVAMNMVRASAKVTNLIL